MTSLSRRAGFASAAADGSLVARMRAWLPRGNSLSDAEWCRRHRVLLVVLWVHIAGLLVFGMLEGIDPRVVALWTVVLCVPATICTLARHRRAGWNSATMSVALLTCSAILVSYWHGRIEAHFDFFVIVVLLTLYEEWLTFLIAAAYVALHHGIVGVVDVNDVYDHAAARNHPWRWAAIHAAFIAAAGAAAVVAWRLNEDVREERRRALERAVAAEAALAESAMELQRSNTELERFASVASHDLSEPLHTISGFIRLLEDRYADGLDERGRAFVRHALDGTERMQRLIDGLLAYSRLSQDPRRREPVAVDRLVADALESLHARIRSTGATISVGELPIVLGDPDRLGQAVQNLLSNALKFHRPGEPPEVEVGARRDGSACALVVRDHGIGIAPQERERVFEMFQRVHAQDAYEGAGIGLAIVERIVVTGGGTIHVEETPGGGATFVVELPAAPQDAALSAAAAGGAQAAD